MSKMPLYRLHGLFAAFFLPLVCMLLFFSISLEARAFSPWYPTEFELQARADYLFQSYRRVASSKGSFRRSANDQFLNLSLGVPYYEWFVEGDIVFAGTEKQHGGLDSLNLFGRYQLLDDVALEDPVSLIVTAFLTKATKNAVADMSSFHHGRFEGGLQLSVGKEFPWEQFWLWRGWGTVALGVADTGSPWLAYGLHLEKNDGDHHAFKFFIDGLYGFGGRSLKGKSHFPGYGPLAHRSLDLGLSYTYRMDCEAEISVGYAQRVYARNFPQQAHLCILSLLYPFSL